MKLSQNKDLLNDDLMEIYSLYLEMSEYYECDFDDMSDLQARERSEMLRLRMRNVLRVIASRMPIGPEV